LMDELDITSRRGSGTRVVCRKWLRAHQPSTRPCPLAFGVATRPRRVTVHTLVSNEGAGWWAR
jgi:hypothetical protein